MSGRRFWPSVPSVLTPRPMHNAPPPQLNPTRGQRVDFPQQAGGQLVALQWFPMLRASDANVACWQVTLSPVYVRGVGPVSEGRPASATGTGRPFFRMTWGAGGVTFRFQGQYPVSGTSFSVAGDTLEIDVMANDGTTVFTPQDVPSVIGWVTPHASPQQPIPYYSTDVGDVALYGPRAVQPFARALWISSDTAGTVITVVLQGGGGTYTLRYTHNEGPVRVPIPSGVNRILSVSGAAGNVWVTEEIAFA